MLKFLYDLEKIVIQPFFHFAHKFVIMWNLFNRKKRVIALRQVNELNFLCIQKLKNSKIRLTDHFASLYLYSLKSNGNMFYMKRHSKKYRRF